MATFYNQATLSYNGMTTTSNITSGEILEVLTATKTAVNATYTNPDTVTYILSLVNSGNVPLTDLTISDDMGAYPFGTTTLTPLTYVNDSIVYYNDGNIQPAPTVTAGAPLTISNISVPPNGNTTIIYQARTNEYTPLGTTGAVTNTATISGGGLTAPVTATATITHDQEPVLSIGKTLSPTVVSENGQITYTFLIQNTGATGADAGDNVTVTDTFNPVLNPIAVTFNGTTWTAPSNYTYEPTTGVFSTTPGNITVEPATYAQNPTTGVWSINPGTSTLTITGNV